MPDTSPESYKDSSPWTPQPILISSPYEGELYHVEYDEHGGQRWFAVPVVNGRRDWSRKREVGR